MLTLKRALKGSKSRASRFSAWLQTKTGERSLFCNSCEENVARFYSYGNRPWGCPLCRSSTRERLVIQLIDSGVLRVDESTESVLHVAPSEKGIIRRLQQISDYHPVDLFPELYQAAATQRMDLMEMDEESRYDIVYLSHVMEHVPDDIQVYRNLHRSLKPGGQAWILVPLSDQPTVDGGNDMTAHEREQNFGQWDHVRQYGPDLANRMDSVGFQVQVLKVNDVDPAAVERLGLYEGDWVFCGTRSH